VQGELDLEDVPVEVAEVQKAPRKSHTRQARIFKKMSEEVLLPSDLRSIIPEDEACLWIREGLGRLDLSSLRALYLDFGGVPYDPLPMLGILLYAYHRGDFGSRTIESRCVRDICYMHVGYGQKPDDRTIRRFRRRVEPVLDEIFRLVLKECEKQGLLPMRLVAVDGTKIASAASQLRRWLSKADREDLAEMGLEPPDCSDPDATRMKAKGGFMVGYNCQAAVDCDSGIVVAVDVSSVGGEGANSPPSSKASFPTWAGRRFKSSPMRVTTPTIRSELAAN
jgi:transposase